MTVSELEVDSFKRSTIASFRQISAKLEFEAQMRKSIVLTFKVWYVNTETHLTCRFCSLFEYPGRGNNVQDVHFIWSSSKWTIFSHSL